MAGLVYGFVVLCPGALEGSTGSGSDFEASQETGSQLLKSRPTDWEKTGIEPVTPGLQDIGSYPTPRQLYVQRYMYCLWRVPWLQPVLAGWVYGFVVAPEGSTGSGSDFLASQKTGPRQSHLTDWKNRGHRFIPYTTASSACAKGIVWGLVPWL